MDAFAISICKGLSAKTNWVKTGFISAIYFGGFQALMPVLGYLCGEVIQRYIKMVSRYMVLVLLCLIGINMIWETLKGEEKEADAALTPAVMLPAAIATSIDAFAVGITLAALNAPLLSSAGLIGITTFFISMAGVGIGYCFGSKLEKQAGILGGAILILMGLKSFF